MIKNMDCQKDIMKKESKLMILFLMILFIILNINLIYAVDVPIDLDLGESLPYTLNKDKLIEQKVLYTQPSEALPQSFIDIDYDIKLIDFENIEDIGRNADKESITRGIKRFEGYLKNKDVVKDKTIYKEGKISKQGVLLVKELIADLYFMRAEKKADDIWDSENIILSKTISFKEPYSDPGVVPVCSTVESPELEVKTGVIKVVDKEENVVAIKTTIIGWRLKENGGDFKNPCDFEALKSGAEDYISLFADFCKDNGKLSTFLESAKVNKVKINGEAIEDSWKYKEMKSDYDKGLKILTDLYESYYKKTDRYPFSAYDVLMSLAHHYSIIEDYKNATYYYGKVLSSFKKPGNVLTREKESEVYLRLAKIAKNQRKLVGSYSWYRGTTNGALSLVEKAIETYPMNIKARKYKNELQKEILNIIYQSTVEKKKQIENDNENLYLPEGWKITLTSSSYGTSYSFPGYIRPTNTKFKTNINVYFAGWWRGESSIIRPILGQSLAEEIGKNAKRIDDLDFIQGGIGILLLALEEEYDLATFYYKEVDLHEEITEKVRKDYVMGWDSENKVYNFYNRKAEKLENENLTIERLNEFTEKHHEYYNETKYIVEEILIKKFGETEPYFTQNRMMMVEAAIAANPDIALLAGMGNEEKTLELLYKQPKFGVSNLPEYLDTEWDAEKKQYKKVVKKQESHLNWNMYKGESFLINRNKFCFESEELNCKRLYEHSSITESLMYHLTGAVSPEILLDMYYLGYRVPSALLKQTPSIYTKTGRITTLGRASFYAARQNRVAMSLLRVGWKVKEDVKSVGSIFTNAKILRKSMEIHKSVKYPRWLRTTGRFVRGVSIFGIDMLGSMGATYGATMVGGPALGIPVGIGADVLFGGMHTHINIKPGIANELGIPLEDIKVTQVFTRWTGNIEETIHVLEVPAGNLPGANKILKRNYYKIGKYDKFPVVPLSFNQRPVRGTIDYQSFNYAYNLGNRNRLLLVTPNKPRIIVSEVEGIL